MLFNKSYGMARSYNLFSGEIKSVNTLKIETKNFNMGYKYEQRMMYNVTGGTFGNTSHTFNPNYQNITNKLPITGGNAFN